MEIFTDIEKRILEKTDKSHKWIARDKNGCLHIYDKKPYRDEGCGVFFFYTEFNCGHLFDKCFSDVLFKNVTWENSPIQYRNDELLTPKERKYLKFVFQPFANDIVYVQKRQFNDVEHIKATTYKSSIVFPDFEKGIMYKEMKPETKYELKELGIEYNE